VKTLEFILSTNRLRDDLNDVDDKVIAFLDKWPEEYPPDISRPHLEEDEICYELEWYQGDHKSIVLFIRGRMDPILFIATGGDYRHITSPTNEQILEEVKKRPIIQGNMSRFWR
jgi:hypothetical protein